MTKTLREEANLLIIENDEVVKLILTDFLKLSAEMKNTKITARDKAIFEATYVAFMAETLLRQYGPGTKRKTA
jgi:hypothetical protein